MLFRKTGNANNASCGKKVCFFCFRSGEMRQFLADLVGIVDVDFDLGKFSNEPEEICQAGILDLDFGNDLVRDRSSEQESHVDSFLLLNESSDLHQAGVFDVQGHFALENISQFLLGVSGTYGEDEGEHQCKKSGRALHGYRENAPSDEIRLKHRVRDISVSDVSIQIWFSN